MVRLTSEDKKPTAEFRVMAPVQYVISCAVGWMLKVEHLKQS